MPFDNTPLETPLPPVKPRPRTCDPVEFLDLLLRVFDDGRLWTAGNFYDRENGSRCLIGGINYVARKHHISRKSADRVIGVLAHTLRRLSINFRCISRGGYAAYLMTYNDRASDFSEIRALILKACKIVLQPIPTKPPPDPRRSGAVEERTETTAAHAGGAAHALAPLGPRTTGTSQQP
jgi:hypothetical protein